MTPAPGELDHLYPRGGRNDHSLADIRFERSVRDHLSVRLNRLGRLTMNNPARERLLLGYVGSDERVSDEGR